MRKEINKIIYFFVYFRQIIREYILGFFDAGIMKRVGDCNGFGIYDVNYYLDGKLYTFRITDEKTHSRPLNIVGDDKKIKGQEIWKYLGPFNNFHLTTPTPELFGKQNMSVQTVKGTRNFKIGDKLVF